MISKKKNNKNYFDQQTEDAIILYNNTEDPIQRNIIYEKYIHYSFFKLTQNIIHTFKFYNTEVDNLEHLQQEIIIFLLSKIHLFNPDKGTKAYSYFGTIVKRWLILYNNKNYMKKINFDNIEDFKEEEKFSFEEKHHVSDEQEDLNYYLTEYINFCDQNLNKLFLKENEIKIAAAILNIFKNRELITIFNKKAIYLYIREIIDESTPRITKVSNKLYKIFKSNYIFYLENGYISFKF